MPPTEPGTHQFEKLKKLVDDQLAGWAELQKTDVPAFPKLVSDRGIPSVVVALRQIGARAFSSTTSLRKANGARASRPCLHDLGLLPLTPLQLAVQPSKKRALKPQQLNLCASFRHRMTSPPKCLSQCPSKLTNAPSLPASPKFTISTVSRTTSGRCVKRMGRNGGDHECFYSRCENRATCGLANTPWSSWRRNNQPIRFNSSRQKPRRR